MVIITSYEPVPSARGLASLAPAYSTDSQLAGGFAPWTPLVGTGAPLYLCLTIILYLSNIKYHLKINYTFFFKFLDTESNLHPTNISPCFPKISPVLFLSIYCTTVERLETLITHTFRWTAQGMGYQGLWVC